MQPYRHLLKTVHLICIAWLTLAAILDLQYMDPVKNMSYLQHRMTFFPLVAIF
jgi:hypothetical protein